MIKTFNRRIIPPRYYHRAGINELNDSILTIIVIVILFDPVWRKRYNTE